MKIMLVGKDGMIGKSIQKYFSANNLITFSKEQFNLEKTNISKIIEMHQPQIFINAAAYTNVNLAEKEKKKAKKINADALGIISKKLKKINSLLIHFSTDYVYDGKKKFAYYEDDQTKPLQYYGFSKNLGDKIISQINCKHIILRTSWVYSYFGNNFVNKIIDQKNNTKEIRVLNNEFGTPTSSNFLAKNVNEICKKYINDSLGSNFSGVYNLSPKGITSRFKFAKFIFDYYNIDRKIIPINSKFPTNDLIVERPRKVYLSKKKIIKSFNLKLINWKSDFIMNMKKN